MDTNIFKPGYRIEIKNDAQARIYRRFLIAKIVVQLILLAGLLALSGWDWKMLVTVGALAAVWQWGPSLWRKYKSSPGRS